MAKLNKSKVVTSAKVRWSYVNVWEPKSVEGSSAKYSIQLIIKKDDQETISRISEAIINAYEEGKGILADKAGNVPAMSVMKLPLRDGDAEKPNEENYKGCYFLNASSVNQPEIVDASCQPIIDHSEVYSGIYGRASITFYAFNKDGKKGIACGLNNLQKIADGEPLGSRTSAKDDFGASEDPISNPLPFDL